jgi:mannosyltransferase OCH1-like enzyme
MGCIIGMFRGRMYKKGKCMGSIFLLFFVIFTTKSQDLFIDFIQGTAPNNKFKEAFIQREGWWRDAKEFYEAYVLNGKKADHVRIPFILHHIWLGSLLPEACRLFRDSWQSFNPSWTYVLWTDDESNFSFGHVVSTYDALHQLLNEEKEQLIVFDIRNMILVNQEAYDATKNYGEKSDILRYEVLYEFGGLYVDTDFECLKPFDVLHYYCDFYTGISYSANFSFLNGLIGSAPKSNILKYCIEDLKKNDGQEAFLEIIYRTGPRHLTRSFFKALDRGYSGIALGFRQQLFIPGQIGLKGRKILI